MTVTFQVTDVRSVASQLRQLAIYLEKHIPNERDADLPPHQRLDYVLRDRSLSDAEATRAQKKGGAR
jgi:hypothetical protein